MMMKRILFLISLLLVTGCLLVRAQVYKFDFTSDKKVKVLSGGERSRLAMIRLLLEPVNLLILDEPTNHLDMRTKDVLKQAIRDFNGTVILVSHDREFLDGLVSKVYEFGGGMVKEHLGGIYEFLQKKKTINFSFEINCLSYVLFNFPK